MEIRIKNKQLIITSDFDINNHKLINISNPTENGDAVNLGYLESYIDSDIDLSGLTDTNINSLTDGNILQYDITSEKWVNVPYFFTDDITVKLQNEKTFGKYVNGDTILATGKSSNEIILDATNESKQPTMTFTISPSTTQEIGSTVSYTLDPGFTANDAGTMSSIIFKKNGITIHTQTDFTNYVDSGNLLDGNNIVFNCEIFYEASDGIISGSLSYSRTAYSAYSRWFGSMATAPTTDTQIRLLEGVDYDNSFTLYTGKTNKFMVIGIPDTSTLVSVIDASALNANITNNYIKSTTITTVDDAARNPINYDIYILSLASPYSATHSHKIILS